MAMGWLDSWESHCVVFGTCFCLGEKDFEREREQEERQWAESTAAPRWHQQNVSELSVLTVCWLVWLVSMVTDSMASVRIRRMLGVLGTCSLPQEVCCHTLQCQHWSPAPVIHSLWSYNYSTATLPPPPPPHLFLSKGAADSCGPRWACCRGPASPCTGARWRWRPRGGGPGRPGGARPARGRWGRSLRPGACPHSGPRPAAGSACSTWTRAPWERDRQERKGDEGRERKRETGRVVWERERERERDVSNQIVIQNNNLNHWMLTIEFPLLCLLKTTEGFWFFSWRVKIELSVME